MKLVMLLAALATLSACSSKPADEHSRSATGAADEPRRTAPAAPATPAMPATRPAPSLAAPATIPGDFPRPCADYAALIDRLKSCDQLGGARASLISAYESLRAAWASVPAERRDEVARQCGAQAESLRNAAAATCGL